MKCNLRSSGAARNNLPDPLKFLTGWETNLIAVLLTCRTLTAQLQFSALARTRLSANSLNLLNKFPKQIEGIEPQ